METNNLSNNIINNNENEIIDINNNILELTNLIDKKSLEIYDINESNGKKIIHYKVLLENIILEYHKTCKVIFKNN